MCRGPVRANDFSEAARQMGGSTTRLSDTYVQLIRKSRRRTCAREWVLKAS